MITDLQAIYYPHVWEGFSVVMCILAAVQ